jgi:hypothetical protein
MSDNESVERFTRCRELYCTEVGKTFASHGYELAEMAAAHDPIVQFAPALAFVSDDPELGRRLHIALSNRCVLEVGFAGDQPILSLLDEDFENVADAPLGISVDQLREWAAKAFAKQEKHP